MERPPGDGNLFEMFGRLAYRKFQTVQRLGIFLAARDTNLRGLIIIASLSESRRISCRTPSIRQAALWIESQPWLELLARDMRR